LLMYNTATSEIFYSTATTTQGKTFVIDHPKKKDNYLVHACLEGPEIGVYYRGKEFIVDKTEIILPDYVESLAYDFTINITPIGNYAELYASEVKNGKFNVYNNLKNSCCKFHWVVYGNRSNIEVEPLKSSVKLKGTGPYKWI